MTVSFTKPATDRSTGHTARERRQRVDLPARICTDSGWQDVRISNASTRGMMLHCASPPAAGSYIEVRCGSFSIVGFVRWSKPGRCGIKARERIDIIALVEGRAASSSAVIQERHKSVSVNLAGFAEATRWARLGNLLFLIALAGAGGFILFDLVHSTLSHTAHQATSALGGIRSQ